MNQALYIDRRIIPATRTDFLVPAAVTFPLSGASIDLWFEEDQYYDGGIVADPTGDLSISRASTGYAQTVAGTLTNFGTNTLRITDKGLLVEDARTNTVSRSQEFDLAWTTQESSVTPNATTAPDGTTTADKVIPSTNLSAFHRISQGVSNVGTTGTPMAWSVYVKAAGYSWIAIYNATIGRVANFDLTNGVVGTLSSGTTATIEALANGWYRCVMMGNSLTNFEAFYININNADGGTSGQVSYTGDGTSGVYLWGGQHEEASFASSYIPTTGSSATRAADAIACSGSLQSVLSVSPLSVVIDLKQNYVIPALASGNNLLSGSAESLSGYADDTFIVDPTTLYVGLGNSQLFSTGTKIGYASTSGVRSAVGGGGTVLTDANASAFGTGIAIRVGGLTGGYPQPWFGYYRRITAWNSRLADATLQGFTYP